MAPYATVRYCTFTLPYGTWGRYGAPVPYRTVPYRAVPSRTVPYRYRTCTSQLSLALLTGLVARANHMFYRFRTAFRVRYVIRPSYEFGVRPVSPFDFLLGSRPCVLTSGMSPRK